MGVVSLESKGLLAARFCTALANGGDTLDSIAYAEGQAWSPTVATMLKSAVAAQTTADLLVAQSPAAYDFNEFVRPQWIVGKIQGFRRVPANCRLIFQDGGTSAAFVGEGGPIPVSAGSFGSGTTLTWAKICGICVITKELSRLSTPSAESTISGDLGRAVAAAGDATFIDPSNAGVADERPPSVTYGAPSVASTGSSIAAIDADLKALYALMVAADVPLSAGVWVMSPTTALYLALQRGTGGSPAYPGITPRGGVLAGLPVVTSTVVSGFIALLDASEILLADDGLARFDRAEHATLQLDDAPTNNSATPTATNLVSLWQAGAVAIKATRYIRWLKRRPESAVVLTGVSF